MGRAHADSITLMWDSSPVTVNGYAVYVGSQRIDVGNTTTYTMTTAVPGQQYCFAVSAYNGKGEGPRSGQVCGYSNEFPTLRSPGSQSSRVGQAVSLQLNGNDPDGLPITYTATGLPPGLFVGTATGFISGTLTTAGTFSITARVSDGILQSAPLTFAWSVTTGSTSSDTTPPLISINSPTASASFTSTKATLALGGTASDNVRVASVSWANNRGGSGTASGTTSWSVASVALQTGTNVITLTARDASGNTATDVLTVTYGSTTTADTTVPTISITGPTSAATYTTTKNVIAVGGTASDNRGVTAVTWANNRGGSGTSSGTTSWSVASIPLQSGSNSITVTARDAAGNKATDVITVTYSTSTSGSTSQPAIVLAGQLVTSSTPLRVSLTWNKVPPANLDLYRNNVLIEKTWNDGQQVDTPTVARPWSYKICHPNTTVCSNVVTIR